MPVEMAPPTSFGQLPQIQPPQSENFLQTMQQGQAVKSGQLSLQEQQMQLNSQKGMMQAWNAAGGDPTKMAQIASQYNVLPKDIMGLQTTLMGMAKTRAETDKDVLAAGDAKNDLINQALQAAYNEPDPTKQGALVSSAMQSLPTRFPNMFKPGDLPVYTGPDSLKQMQAAYTTHQWITAQAAAMRGQAAATQAGTAATREGNEAPAQQAAGDQAKRAGVATQLSSAPDAAGYDKIRDASGMAAQFPPSRLVYDPSGTQWLPGQQAAVNRVGMTAEQKTQADQAAATAAQNALPKTPAELAIVANDPTQPQARRDAATAALGTLTKQAIAARPVTNINTVQPGLATPSKLTGQDYLHSLPVGTAAQVKAIAEGRATMPSGSTRSQAAIQLRNGVFQYDPSYSDQRAQVRKAFTTGPDGRNIGALNTATVHLDQLADAAKALNTGDVQAINGAMNALKTQFGSSAPTNFETLKNAVAGELASALKGNATDPEIANVSRSIQAANSPAQLSGVVDTNMHVLGAKLNTYQQRYQQQIPGDTVYNPILPAARGVFQKHGFDPTSSSAAASGAGRIIVTASDGRDHPFDTEQQAQTFEAAVKKAGGTTARKK
jgi:hypothetical protein